MTTTFTGPHHGPWGADETFTGVAFGCVWSGEIPRNYTPTTTWTGPVGAASDRTPVSADDFRRHLEHSSETVSTWPDWKQKLLGGQPAQRPGVTPAPFPKPALDRIGPYIVSDVREAVRACAGSVYETNTSSDFKLVCDVLRRLYAEGK